MPAYCLQGLPQRSVDGIICAMSDGFSDTTHEHWKRHVRGLQGQLQSSEFHFLGLCCLRFSIFPDCRAHQMSARGNSVGDKNNTEWIAWGFLRNPPCVVFLFPQEEGSKADANNFFGALPNSRIITPTCLFLVGLRALWGALTHWIYTP